MTGVVLGGMRVLAATKPGRALLFRNQLVRIAKRDAIFVRELLCAGADEQDVFTFFQDAAGQADRVAHALDGSNGPSLESCAIHEDRIELNAAVEGEVRAKTGVEHGVVFQADDGGFDGIRCTAAARENSPAGIERMADPITAGRETLFGNSPGTAVNDEGGSQGGQKFV